MTVLWHNSLDAQFDPITVVKPLAESLHLVIRESTSDRTGRVTRTVSDFYEGLTRGREYRRRGAPR
jgi:hypothetical protein